jgi:hypothetical protein
MFSSLQLRKFSKLGELVAKSLLMLSSTESTDRFIRSRGGSDPNFRRFSGASSGPLSIVAVVMVAVAVNSNDDFS